MPGIYITSLLINIYLKLTYKVKILSLFVTGSFCLFLEITFSNEYLSVITKVIIIIIIINVLQFGLKIVLNEKAL